MSIRRIVVSMLLALAAVPVITVARADEKEERNEKVITLDQVPPPARESIIHEAAGAQIMKVEEETEKGVVVYEAHLRPASGADFAVGVDAVGKVLWKGAER